jgi:hypothetical protein
MLRSLPLFTLAILLSLPAAANAQDQPPPPPTPGSSQGYMYGAYGKSLPGHHEHEGFFFRVGTGVGYTQASAEEDFFDVTVKGLSGSLTLAAGANIVPNLIIYGAVFAAASVEPSLEVNGEEIDDLDNVTAGIRGLGVGMAYYLPSNIYFSGTLGVAQLVATFDDGDVEEESETEFGPAFSGQIGKEWWVSSNWGLGIAGQLLFGSMKDDEDSDITWTATGFALLFSATYD